MKPGQWHVQRTPAVYGSRAERVLVQEATVTYDHVPAVTRSVERTVVVRPGGVKWEHRRGLFGREKLCKVQTPPVTRTVTEQVVVAPARRVAHQTPAVYRTVNRPVLIQRASVSRVYEAPMYANVVRPVVVRDASRRVVSSGSSRRRARAR